MLLRARRTRLALGLSYCAPTVFHRGSRGSARLVPRFKLALEIDPLTMEHMWGQRRFATVRARLLLDDVPPAPVPFEKGICADA